MYQACIHVGEDGCRYW